MSASKALEEWGCESATAELIAWDIVEGVKVRLTRSPDWCFVVIAWEYADDGVE